MKLLSTASMFTAVAALSAPAAAREVAGFAINPHGSLGYATGIAVAKTVTAKVDGITGRPRPMGGSTTSIPIVNRGEVDFGFANVPEAVARLQKAAPPGSLLKVSDTKLPGIKGPTNIVQFDDTLFTHKDTDDETVYKITKGLATNTAHLAGSMGAFKRTKPGTFATPKMMPYHPGALKALKELGMR